MSVVPQKQKKRAVKKDKRGTERKKESDAPMRSVNGIKKNTPQGMRRIFLAARPISYLHHTVLDHIVVTEQFLYDSTLYYMEQRLLQCI